MGRPPSCLCGTCAKCRRREYMRRWYKNRPGYAAEIQRRRRQTGEAARYERERYHGNEEFRNKKLARNMVLIRVSQGTMQRQPCEVCGCEPAEAHHDDYSRPLDVRWLCNTHHREHHAREYAKGDF